MKKTTFLSLQVACIMALFLSLNTPPVKAQDKVEVSIGADIVSRYIWRGQDCAGISVQPSITLSKSGFFVEAWSSVGIDNEDIKEVNLSVGYESERFSATITDYWIDEDDKYFTYAAHETGHTFGANLAYDFGLFAVSWDTYFAGDDYCKVKNDGSLKRTYSSYVEASAPFKLGGLDFTAEIGFTPWEGAYSEGLNVVNIGVQANKEVAITNTFSIPMFAKLIVNPNKEKVFFVFGLTF